MKQFSRKRDQQIDKNFRQYEYAFSEKTAIARSTSAADSTWLKLSICQQHFHQTMQQDSHEEPIEKQDQLEKYQPDLDLPATQLIQLKQEQSSLIHTNKSFQNNDKENQGEIKNILELHQSSQHAPTLVTGMTICRSIAKIKKFLSLIALFCYLIVLSAVGHGLWLLRQYHHFTWYVTIDSPIQFLARRSIRSSTRSENKIATVSQIAYDILHSDVQKEQTDISTTNSDRSTPMSYYTHL